MHIGATLGRRFTLTRAEEFDLPGVDRYVATDERLRTDVMVDVVTSLAPSTVRQAAIRAALIRDPRLQRVISTGRELLGGDEVTYVVTQRLLGTSVRSLLTRYRLPAAIANAIAGEVARALEASAAKGMHHGVLRPASVTVTRRGRVVVSGLGIDSELAAQGGVDRGRSERDDAVAVGRLYLAAVTGLDADEATLADLPSTLSPSAQSLCKAVIRGTGPRTLKDVIISLQPFNNQHLRDLPGQTAAFPLRPALAAEQEALDQARAQAEAEALAASLAIEEETLALAELAASIAEAEGLVADEAVEVVEAKPETGLVAPSTPDDPTALDTFDQIAADQNVKRVPALWEDIAERLHRRWPRSAWLSRAANWAHDRATRPAPIRSGPIIMATSVVLVVLAAMVAVSQMTDPFEPDFQRHNPPANTYPPFTFEPSPTVTPTPENSE